MDNVLPNPQYIPEDGIDFPAEGIPELVEEDKIIVHETDPGAKDRDTPIELDN